MKKRELLAVSKLPWERILTKPFFFLKENPALHECTNS